MRNMAYRVISLENEIRVRQYHLVNFTEAINCAVLSRIHFNIFGDQKETYYNATKDSRQNHRPLSVYLPLLNSQNDTVRLSLFPTR